MNLIKKLTAIFLVILTTLRIKKKPKDDNSQINELLKTAILSKPKEQDQSGDYLLRTEDTKDQSETEYLLSTEANKERLLESVASIRDKVQAERDDAIVTAKAEIKSKVEDRQEKIETKVEEIKQEFDQKKCADVIAKVAEKVFNESPTKMTGFQSIGVDRKKREVDSLKEKQSKGKKLNRKERNRIEMYNKHNAVNTTNSNDVVLQQQTMTNLLLVSAVDDTPVQVKSSEPKNATPEYTGSGGSYSGGGASSSWETPSPSHSSSRDDDRSWSGSSSSSSSYDSGSSSSYDSGSSSSSSSDW